MSDSRVLHYPELKELGVRYSKSHLYKLIKDGNFPKSMRLTDNIVVWLREDIEAWIQSKIDAHRAKQLEQRV